MNYIEQFKKDNRIKDNEHFYVGRSNGNIYEVYFKENTLFIVDNIYPQDRMLLSLLTGYRKISSRYISELERELIEFWKSKGFDTYKRIKERSYIKNKENGTWYLVSQNGLFNGLFEFADEFDFDEVLEKSKVKK